VDTYYESDIHRRAAERYMAENPYVDEAGAALATKFESDRELEARDEGDEEFLGRLHRLWPNFHGMYQRFVHAQAAEGPEGPRHPSPNPPRPPGPEPGPEIHAPMPPPPPADLGQAAERFLRGAGDRISERHAAEALAYQRANDGCSWAEAVYLTREGG
jgi:hypothetical protein